MTTKVIAVISAAAILTGAALVWNAATADQAVAQETTSEQAGPWTEVLDGLVAEGTLTQAQADAVQEAVSEYIAEHGPRRGFHHRGAGHLETAAEVIGVEVEDLATALRDGQTLAQVAVANGVSADAVVDALVAEAEAKIAEAVEAGRLTQEQADEKLADVAEKIDALVNEGPSGEFQSGRRGPGRSGPRGSGGFGFGGFAPSGESSSSA